MSERTERRSKRGAVKEGNSDNSEDLQKDVAGSSNDTGQISPKKPKLVEDETEGVKNLISSNAGKLHMKFKREKSY